MLYEGLQDKRGGTFSRLFGAASLRKEKPVAKMITVSGSGCDGQVLVCNDLLGFSTGFCPKFVKKYANVHDVILQAMKDYKTEVEAGTFPAAEHTFTISEEVMEKLY